MLQRNTFKLLAAVLLTSACAPLGSPMDSPKQVKVDVASESYVVKLTQRANALRPGEKEELEHYLRTLGDLQDVEFSIRRTHRGMQVESMTPVVKQLIAGGADPHKIYRLAEIGYDYQGAWADVEIIAKRYVAVPPDCPDFSRPETIDNQNRTSSDFGCSTANALALSVADPRDIARGRDTAPASGTHSEASVDRYNTDKVKELEDTSTRQKTN